MQETTFLKILTGHEPRQQSRRAWAWRLLILLLGALVIGLVSFRIVLPLLYQWAVFAGVLATYLVVSYLLLPWLWRIYTHVRLPKRLPNRSYDSSGIADDPINIALVGSKRKVLKVMSLMGWQPLEPRSPFSILKSAQALLFNKPYPQGPMDARFLWGRKSDLGLARRADFGRAARHHIRLWQAQELIDSARVWVGNVHFDKHIGVRYITGQLTHRISPDVDGERDLLMSQLKELGLLKKVQTVTLPNAAGKFKNSGGSRYHTDGKLKVAIL